MVSGPGRGATPGPLTFTVRSLYAKNGSAASSVTTHLPPSRWTRRAPEGHASHRVRLIPVQAVTTLSTQPMSAWLARPRRRQAQGVGQQDPKRGAATGAVLHPGPPAVQFGEASNQRQPDADAGGVAEMLRSLPERLEHGRPQPGWDTRAGVLHRDQHALVVAGGPDPD